MICKFLIAGLALAAAPLAAQPMPCPGAYATIRFNDIKPGKAAVAAQAVAEHQAWYAKRKAPVSVERVTVLKSAGAGAMVADPGKLLTITRYRGAPQRPDNDADWNAFVAKYRDSTTQISEVRACLK